MMAKARLRYLGTSAQKTRLVLDQIRGLGVNQALATLGESPKAVSRDMAKLLRSAVANAQKGDQRVDADTLFISRAFVDGGPSLKRIRPATFGRAFRVLRRSCHITVELDAREGVAPRLSRAKRRARTAKEAAAGSPPAEGSPKTGSDRPAKGSRTGAGARSKKKGTPSGATSDSEE
jgi:large subunit ribosomal protein L22